MLSERTVERIRAYARAHGLTKSGLAKAAGLSKNACMHMDRDDWSPNLATIRQIEALIPKDFDDTATNGSQP